MARVATVEDQADVLVAVDAIEEGLYKTKTDVYQQKLLSAAKWKWMKMVTEKMGDGEGKPEWLRELRRQLKGMMVVRLVLAVEPTVEMVDRIAGWVKEKVSERAMVEWEVDGGLIGGLCLSWGGKWVDASVALKLEEFWKSYEWTA